MGTIFNTWTDDAELEARLRTELGDWGKMPNSAYRTTLREVDGEDLIFDITRIELSSDGRKWADIECREVRISQ